MDKEEIKYDFDKDKEPTIYSIIEEILPQEVRSKPVDDIATKDFAYSLSHQSYRGASAFHSLLSEEEKVGEDPLYAYHKDVFYSSKMHKYLLYKGIETFPDHFTSSNYNLRVYRPTDTMAPCLPELSSNMEVDNQAHEGLKDSEATHTKDVKSLVSRVIKDINSMLTDFDYVRTNFKILSQYSETDIQAFSRTSVKSTLEHMEQIRDHFKKYHNYVAMYGKDNKFNFAYLASVTMDICTVLIDSRRSLKTDLAFINFHQQLKPAADLITQYKIRVLSTNVMMHELDNMLKYKIEPRSYHTNRDTLLIYIANKNRISDRQLFQIFVEKNTSEHIHSLYIGSLHEYALVLILECNAVKHGQIKQKFDSMMSRSGHEGSIKFLIPKVAPLDQKPKYSS
jgi:hypothetical protein